MDRPWGHARESRFQVYNFSISGAEGPHQWLMSWQGADFLPQAWCCKAPDLSVERIPAWVPVSARFLVGDAVLAEGLLPDLYLSNHRGLARFLGDAGSRSCPRVICPNAGSGKPEDSDAP